MTSHFALAEGWASLALAVSWQLAALAILAMLYERLLKPREARVRHALWWFVLLAPLVLGPGRLALAQRDATMTVALPVASLAVSPPAQALPTLPADSSLAPTLGWNDAAAARPAPVPPWWNAWRLADMLGLAWLLGCSLLVLRLVVGCFWARALLSVSHPIEDSAITKLLTSIRSGAGVKRVVDLRGSSLSVAPMLYGVRRPVILVPDGWLGSLGEAELTGVLAHEMAHVKRNDVLASLVQRAAEALLFFHPAVWMASRRITLAREELCDAHALRGSRDRAGYARSLLSAAELQKVNLAAASVSVAEGGSTLRKRVEAIMDSSNAGRTNRSLLLACAVLLVLAAGALGAVQLRAVASSSGGGGGGGGEPVRALDIPPAIGAEALQVDHNMKEIALAVQMYLVDNDYRFPPASTTEELMDVLANYVVTPRVFMRPGTEDEVVVEYTVDPGVRLDSLERPAETIIATAAYRPEFTVDAFADGHVELRVAGATPPSGAAAATGGGGGGGDRAGDRPAVLALPPAVRAEALQVDSNMKHIALALHMYASDNHDRLSPTNDINEVMDVLQVYVIDRAVFSRPGTSDEVVVRCVMRAVAVLDSLEIPFQTPVAIVDYHPDFRVTAFADGHVELHGTASASTGGGGGGGGGGGHR